MISTLQNKKRKIIIALIWLVIWQIMASLIGEEILLPSPFLVLQSFFELIATKEFYITILSSFGKIFIGFVFSICLGLVLAYFSYKYDLFYEFINPIIVIFRSIPLASLVIFFLFWINTKNLSILVSFIMAMPIIYTNTYVGLKSIDKKLLQMASIYEVKELDKLKYIYLIKAKDFIKSSIISVSGLVLKAGIAGEVIGLPDKSIGKNLYNTKIYLDMPSLLAWTLSILILSFIFEHSLRKILEEDGD